MCVLQAGVDRVSSWPAWPVLPQPVRDPPNFVEVRGGGPLARQRNVNLLQRQRKTPRPVPALQDVAPFRQVKLPANLLHRVAQRRQQIHKPLHRLLEMEILFPERVVGVNQQDLGLVRHQGRGSARGAPARQPFQDPPHDSLQLAVLRQVDFEVAVHLQRFRRHFERSEPE